MERCLEHSQGSPEPSEPLLPPEIERKIFEMAACSHRPCIPKLIRVAKRIRIWIEPLLYRVVTVVEPHRVRTSLPYIMIPGMKGIALVDPYYIPPHLLYITAGDCLRMLESRAVSDSFFRDHILHLALAGLSEDQTEHILSKCNGLVDLGLFAGHYSQSASLLPIITAMPLQRLACDLSVLFPSTGVDFNHALFSKISKITHLNLYQGEGLFPASWARSLGNLPCLTHLSFDEPSLHENGAGQSFLQGVLASCKALEPLVVICRNKGYLDAIPRVYWYFHSDPRSVVIFVADYLYDWQLGAEGGADYWVRAEQFIKKRRSGEIEASCYVVPGV